MAILRSRSRSAASFELANPLVKASLAQWEQRLQATATAARSAGEAEALARLEERLRLAEERAATAERERDQGIAAAQAAVCERLADLERTWDDRWAVFFQRVAAVAEELEPMQAGVVKAAEREVVRLGLEVAARILRRTVETDPTWFDPLLEEVLAQVPDRRRVILRVAPEDLADLEERWTALARERRLPPNRPEMVAEEGLPRGSLVAESAGTTIDASLPATWERVTADLAGIAPSGDWRHALGDDGDLAAIDAAAANLDEEGDEPDAAGSREPAPTVAPEDAP